MIQIIDIITVKQKTTGSTKKNEIERWIEYLSEIMNVTFWTNIKPVVYTVTSSVCCTDGSYHWGSLIEICVTVICWIFMFPQWHQSIHIHAVWKFHSQHLLHGLMWWLCLTDLYNRHVTSSPSGFLTPATKWAKSWSSARPSPLEDYWSGTSCSVRTQSATYRLIINK